MTDRRSRGPTRPSRGDVEGALEGLFRSGRANAALAWLLVAVLVVLFVESLAGGDYQWAAFAAFVGAVVLVPPIAYREWRVMIPWELLGVTLTPVLVRGLLGGPAGTFATYFAIAGLALIVTVELHMFTALSVTHWFAVALVVLTTLAVVAAWTIVRWGADQYLGTAYLVDNETLMVEWLWVTAAGISAGVLFDVYFTRRDRQLWQTIQRTVGR